LVFASLGQEMDLTIRSFNFPIGSRLYSPFRSDKFGSISRKNRSRGNFRNFGWLIQQGKFAGEHQADESKGNIVEELDKIIENLDLEESSNYSDMASDENLDNNNYLGEDFMIYYGNVSDKSTDTWKTRLELYDDEQTIFLGSSSGINN
jgi:hypothetical protein